MGRRRCCCEENCYFFIDNFDRADNDNPGVSWYECSGDSDIVSSRLRLGANAFLRCEVPYPYDNCRQIVFATTYDEQDGDIYRVHVWKDKDCLDGFYAEYEYSASGDSYLRLLDSMGNPMVGEVIDGLTNNERTIKVCCDEIGIVASVSNCVLSLVWSEAECGQIYSGSGTGTPLVSGTGTLAGPYFALENGTSNPIWFTQAIHALHWLDDPTCPACICQCYNGMQDRSMPPKNITATFYGYGGCSGLTGFSLEMVYDRLTQEWEGEGTAPCDGKPAYFHLKMSCSAYPNTCNDWTLSNYGDCKDSDPNNGLNVPPSSCSCDPFELCFDFSVQGSDLACLCCTDGFGTGEAGTYRICLTA